jgi:transposase
MSRVPEKERAQYESYVNDGWTIAEIARKFKRQRHTIERWIDPERKDLKDRKGRGPKRTTTVTEDKKIVQKYKKTWRKKSTGRRRISKELKGPSTGLPEISGDTVYRRIKEAGGKMKTVEKRFALTDRHKSNRVQFAKDMKKEDFDKWLWSDETKFEIGTRKRKVFQFPGEELEQVTFKHPVSQLVWACVSSSGPGEMAFIEGTLNGHKYKDLLEKHMLKAAKKLFDDEEWKV